MLKMMLVFIFIFVYFIAIALNYAKAFRIKNDIIDYLEDNQIDFYDESYISNENVNNDIEKILSRYNYDYSSACNSSYDIGSKCIKGLNIKGERNIINGVYYIYYNIDVLINYDIGFLKLLLSLTNTSDNSSNTIGTWIIRGQSKAIISA